MKITGKTLPIKKENTIMIQWSKTNDALGTVNRGNPCESSLCTLCRADCQGKCETCYQA